MRIPRGRAGSRENVAGDRDECRCPARSCRSGPFIARAGRCIGVGEERMRGRDLVRPFRGVRVLASAIRDLEMRCRAYGVRMRRSRSFASHGGARSTASRSGSATTGDRRGGFGPHGLPRWRGSGAIECGNVTSDPKLVTRAARGVACRHLAPARRGARAPGAHHDRRRARARSHPLAAMDELAAAFRRRGARRGLRARAALGPSRTDGSPAETELRLDLVEFGLPEPVVNLDILDRIRPSDRHRRPGLPRLPGARRVRRRPPSRRPGPYARDVDRLDDLAHAGGGSSDSTPHRGTVGRNASMRVHEALVAAGWRPGAM